MNEPAKGVLRPTGLCGSGESTDDQRKPGPICESRVDFSVARDVGFLVNRDDRRGSPEGDLQHDLVGVHPLRGYRSPAFDLDSQVDQLRLQELYKVHGLKLVMGEAFIVEPC